MLSRQSLKKKYRILFVVIFFVACALNNKEKRESKSIIYTSLLYAEHIYIYIYEEEKV